MSKPSDFVIENGVLKQYDGPGGDVVIPAGVTCIGNWAFEHCSSLTSVTIPEGVTSIGDRVFADCRSLVGIRIPGSVAEIGLDAFLGCSNLKVVTISDLAAWCGIKFAWRPLDYSSNPLTYANDLYLDKELLSDLIIPAGVTSIGDSAFRGCSSLKSVTIPSSVEKIGVEAFSYSGLTSVAISNGVKRVGKEAFLNCRKLAVVTVFDLAAWCDIDFSDSPFSLAHPYELHLEKERITDLFVPEGVTRIGKFAFSNCSSIAKAVIPDSVTSIGEHAFSGCSHLTGLVLPAGVTRIENDTFSGCSSLTSVTIPGGVTRIGSKAFWDCSGLSSVTIPEGVTRIGDFAFSGCRDLTYVTIPDSVTCIGEGAFDKDTQPMVRDLSLLPSKLRKNKALQFLKDGCPKSDPGYADCCKYIRTNSAKLLEDVFSDPAKLSAMCREKLITPRNAELYAEAVQKTGNAELIALMVDYQANKISDKEKEFVEKRKEKEQNTIIERKTARFGKAEINDLIFAVTGKLETFENRDELKAFIREKGGKLASSLTGKVDYLIMNDPTSDSIKARKAQELGVEIISEHHFNKLAGRPFDMNGTELVRYCGKGGDVIIPAGVTSIGERAFYNNRSLTSVTIPESVTHIGEEAFESCRSLRKATIPESVASIGDCAFYDCSSLTEVSVPDGVVRINNGVFSGCKNLKSVTIPKSVKEIGRAAFYGCRSLVDTTIPDGVTSIGASAFFECICLTSITVPESVIGMDELVFGGCEKLTIHAPAGSYAEQYAKENNIPFVVE